MLLPNEGYYHPKVFQPYGESKTEKCVQVKEKLESGIRLGSDIKLSRVFDSSTTVVSGPRRVERFSTRFIWRGDMFNGSESISQCRCVLSDSERGCFYTSFFTRHNVSSKC